MRFTCEILGGAAQGARRRRPACGLRWWSWLGELGGGGGSGRWWFAVMYRMRHGSISAPVDAGARGERWRHRRCLFAGSSGGAHRQVAGGGKAPCSCALPDSAVGVCGEVRGAMLQVKALCRPCVGSDDDDAFGRRFVPPWRSHIEASAAHPSNVLQAKAYDPLLDRTTMVFSLSLPPWGRSLGAIDSLLVGSLLGLSMIGQAWGCGVSGGGNGSDIWLWLLPCVGDMP